MSVAHPIIAVTGSSGAGTSTVKHAFNDMFRREDIKPVVIEGDSFHRYDRQAMKEKTAEYEAQGKILTHFGPDANELDKLEALFKEYSDHGTGKKRLYVHDDKEAALYGHAPGTFTSWEPIDPDSHLLFYEGLHGGIITDQVNVARHVDLLIGVVPVVNLEWIQKIHRDCLNRGYSSEAVVQIILKRMPDYVHYICPQFTHTHINFQRVPLVDTSDPFIARDIPTPDESNVVIRFRNPHMADFPYYLKMLNGSFMSRANTIVVPGGKMGLAMEVVLTPIIHDIMARKQEHS
ncbi:phosphoribulokinase [Candidatus Nitrosacidococcus sp. I8]|uniref:phosphoribulokinase n=1 Tax=Candidatus Nitrosacidococcus sp. I8 TaxID=2942908 RepID=UPI0022272FBA|nr:phosphoribulokinase [Candidatus Nitrosacidococcus sp. I8]CAH9015753.1 Phosphoribulokinase, plasmid [Candidatus Nitrosacidococcus sp. I8]